MQLTGPLGGHTIRRHCPACQKETDMRIIVIGSGTATWRECTDCRHYAIVRTETGPSL